MANAVAADAFAAILGQALAPGTPKDVAPERLTCGVPPDDLLDLLMEAVDDLVPVAIDELRPVRRRLFAWQNPPAAAPELSPAERDRRARGVEQAWATTVRLEPDLRRLAAIAQPELYLAPFRPALLSLIGTARGHYCTAIAEALRGSSPNLVQAWIDRGDAAARDVPRQVTEMYLRPIGLEMEIQLMGERVLELLALRAQRGAQALPTRGADAAAGVTQPLVAGRWSQQARLLARLQDARDVQNTVLVDGVMRGLSHELQGLGLLIGVLGTRERLSWLADQAVVEVAAAVRLRQYVTSLEAALTHLEAWSTAWRQNDFATAGDRVLLAQTAATAVTGTAAFAQDIDSITSLIQMQEVAKDVANAVAILGATALVSGGVGLFAELAVESAVAGTLAEGTYVARLGVITITAFAETLTVRSVNELFYGRAAVGGTSFVEDLGWQVLQSAALEAVLWSVNAVFKAATRSARQAPSGIQIAVGQISLFAFGEVQHWAKTGKLRTWDERLQAGVQQLASAVLVAAGRMLLTRFLDRLGMSPNALTPAMRDRFNRLEQERAQVETDFGRIRDGTATDAEFVAWAQRASGVWNRWCEFAESLPAGPDRERVVTDLMVAKAGVELRLAELGIRADLSLPSVTPSFRGLMPGVIAVADDAEPVLTQRFPLAQRQATSVPDVTRATLPSGARLLFLPAGNVVDTPPLPNRPVHVPEAMTEGPPPSGETDDSGDGLDDLARRGRDQLRAALGSDAKVEEFLALVPEGHVEEFLCFLGGPGFASPAVVNARRSELKAIAAHPESIAFGRRFGADVLFRLRRRLGTGAALEDGLRRATALLEDAPPGPPRDAVADALAGARDRRALGLLLGTVRPRTERRRVVTSQNLGIDRDSVEWRERIRPEVEQEYSGRGYTAQQLDVVADLRQVKQAAARGGFERLSPQTKLAILDRIDAMQAAVGLNRQPFEPGCRPPGANRRDPLPPAAAPARLHLRGVDGRRQAGHCGQGRRLPVRRLAGGARRHL